MKATEVTAGLAKSRLMAAYHRVCGVIHFTSSAPRADCLYTRISSGLMIEKCRWARLKRQWTFTFHINLVGFYPVLLQLLRLNCVQQASISIRVNSSTSTRGQHVCVSLLAMGDTSMLGGLYASLCHAFLVFTSESYIV